MFFRLFCLFLFWRFVTTDDQQKDGICPPVLDIIILFDTSGGNDTVFEQQKNWTIKIVRDLPIHEDAVRVGLVQYSDDAKTEFNLSKYSERNDIIKHLETLVFMAGEDTRTGVALNKGEEEIFNYTGGARLKATRLIIVFTDGLSMDKPTLAAKSLRRKGVKIYTISVNSIGFVPEMLGIVGDADNVFGPNDEDRIEERLLSEVEHSRSCDVQPKRNEKTTSSFGLKTTEFISTSTSAESPPTTKNATTTTTIFSSSTTQSSSEEMESENNVEDIGHNETVTTELVKLRDVTSPVSWIEPVQLFTVETESTHENKVQNLTNLMTSLSEETNTSEAKNEDTEKKLDEEVSKSTTPENITTTEASTTISTTVPVVTTICINPPTTTIQTTMSSHSSTKSFLVKLGVEKEKVEKDPLSKFLGRDVSNSDLAKDSLDISTIGNNSNSSEILNSSEETNSSSTNRFFFSTRVTFRPVSLTSSTPSTTTATTTTTPTTTTTTTTAPTTKPSTTLAASSPPSTVKNEIKESLTKSTSVTPNQKSSSLFKTLSAVTAFPTLLSMEKAVTLPINSVLGVSKPIKKKIRRIIKRRRNILPSSQAKKVTEKVLEVKRVPTPTTPPIRSTLRPLIIEEKQEETFTSGVQCPMDILFVVDSSGSIARTYDTQKDYLTQLIKKVEPSRSHRVGLIQFAGPHIQKMEWSFDTHSKNSQLLSAIRSVRHLTGTTYIGAALELSLILLDSRRKHTETTVILISDGFSQDDSTQQAKLLRQLPNVKMYAISLNKLTNTKYLTDIVGDRKNLFINDESQWFEEFFTKKLRCVPTTR
uniref:VWFA domain-containing protein n=1 Tax=Caenorhabditis tropicalis TaxID=1561998 RepID=A0A1I7TR74_9PELO